MAEYSRALSDEGARSLVSSRRENSNSNSFSKSEPDIVPPPPEVFTRARQQPLYGLFGLAGELRHLASALAIPVAPKQGEPISLWQKCHGCLNACVLTC